MATTSTRLRFFRSVLPWWGRIRCSLLLALLAASFACGGSSASQVAPAPQPVWPAPPATPRIRYLGSLPRVEQPQPSWLRVLFEAVVGLDEENRPPQPRIIRPYGVAAAGGVVWVADPDGGTVWRIPLESGRLERLSCDETFAPLMPIGLAIGPGDALYVADAEGKRVVVFNRDGRCVKSIGQGLFERPVGVAWLPQRHLLAVVDAASHRVLLLDPDGGRQLAVGGRGIGPTQFNYPTHLAADERGRLFVVDAMNYAIKWFDPADGLPLGAMGTAGDAPGLLSKAKGIAHDSDGHVYVVDAMQDQVFIFGEDGTFLLAFGGSGQGAGEFSLPSGVAIDNRDRIFVADSQNHRVQVFQYLRPGGAP